MDFTEVTFPQEPANESQEQDPWGMNGASLGQDSPGLRPFNASITATNANKNALAAPRVDTPGIDALTGLGAVHSSAQPTWDNTGIDLDLDPPDINLDPDCSVPWTDPHTSPPYFFNIPTHPRNSPQQIPRVQLPAKSRQTLWTHSSGSRRTDTSESTSWINITPAASVTDSSGSPVRSEAYCNILPRQNPAAPISSTNPVKVISKDWVIPKKTRKKRQNQTRAPPSRRSGEGVQKPAVQPVPRRRGAFRDEETREQTALTRALKCCLRCRMQKNRCEPNPSSPEGPCLNCQKVDRSRTKIYVLPCQRTIITDLSVYREQDMPYQLFSKRWQNMDLVDISDWASADTKTINITHVYFDGVETLRSLETHYTVHVREFIPLEGDMLEEKWVSNGVTKSHLTPRFALADMNRVAAMMEDFMGRSAGIYINATIGELDPLIWTTYCFAFRHVKEAKTREERELLADVIRLWVACRKTSNQEHIVGGDDLGALPVSDPGSVFHNKIPIPAIIMAQMECIMYTKVLRPKHKKVLSQLHEMVISNKADYWLTIYLTKFVLCHSCSMISRRDHETARQYCRKSFYANPQGIAKHHFGMNVMLSHFHYLNKGAAPFRLNPDGSIHKDVAKIAKLTDDETRFVQETALLLNESDRATKMKDLRDGWRIHGNLSCANNDLYWLSQLYDTEWEPGPTFSP